MFDLSDIGVISWEAVFESERREPAQNRTNSQSSQVALGRGPIIASDTEEGAYKVMEREAITRNTTTPRKYCTKRDTPL